MTIPASKIYALFPAEAAVLDNLSGREGIAWTAWRQIGSRLGVDVRPLSGPIISIERVGWQSIAITWMPRKMKRRVSIVEGG